MEAVLKSPYEAAPTLMKVGPKAVEWDGQSRDMEGVLDKHSFTVQSKHGCPNQGLEQRSCFQCGH
jgi:hypothetical protein